MSAAALSADGHGRPLVLVSWDGRSAPLACIEPDAAPAFDGLLFDYSGHCGQRLVDVHGRDWPVLSQATECKGEIYAALAARLGAAAVRPEYVALLDDDVWIATSAINRALHLARLEGLDVFSPVLTHDSEYTHRWTLAQPNRLFREVDWVEVMMPFLRTEILLAMPPLLAGNVSSWGIDRYLVPTLQQLQGRTRTALVDAVVASHRRPVTSGMKRYRNGLTAAEEMAGLRERCIALLQRERPELVGGEWYRRVFERRHARTPWQRVHAAVGRALRHWLEAST